MENSPINKSKRSTVFPPDRSASSLDRDPQRTSSGTLLPKVLLGDQDYNKYLVEYEFYQEFMDSIHKDQ